ncbi:EamA family transporter [Brevibacillus brevis]|uniref:DMT family transporter n=1 Tax=Brevibacillus brevis TaxID=1393 RepID=UPI000B38C805|nr:DMT family transporter [Brevibacillus brevis]OUQ87717.1 EamA family transporter [Brevibacillus brevis]
MNRTNFLLLLGIGLIWGSQFFFVDLVISSIPPVTLAACKALLGAITLAVLYGLSRNKESISEPAKAWKLFIWVGLLEAVVPFILIGYGQQFINSSTASILLGTGPIFTILFVKIFSPSEKLPLSKWLSILLGFAGLCLLFSPNFSSFALEGSSVGYIALLGASISFSASLLLIKRLPPMSSILAMRNVLWIASVVLIPLAFIYEDPFGVRLNWHQVIYVFILGVFQAGIVYMMYNTLIKRTGATFASLTNYLVPLFGVLLGSVILGDQLTWNAIVALVIIFISMAISEKRTKQPRTAMKAK